MASDAIPAAIRPLLLDIKNRMLINPWVSKVMLYGSYADGRYTENSDVDIAVFAEDDFHCGLEQYRQLSRICCTARRDIQMQLFSIDELEDPCGIVQEVVEHGQDITGV